MSNSPSPSIDIPRLGSALDCRVIRPDDAAYDQARTIFYGGLDRHPATIIRPIGDAEVAQVVNLARDNGLELAVRSGGHSIAGHSLTDGGIVLDLAELTPSTSTLSSRLPGRRPG
jgi:FAD/FMN-containing dehydrogenase